MVFETVVSSQLNKFLGAYIENLNSSQLKLGLLGGEFSYLILFACQKYSWDDVFNINITMTFLCR